MFAQVVARRSQRRSRTSTWILTLLLLAAVAAAVTYFLTSRGPSAPPFVKMPIRVVHDRPGGARIAPGATISEPEAMLRLQQSLNLKVDCVAIMSKGYRDGAYDLTAVNRCDGTRLGRWRVDGKSGAVNAAKPRA